MNYDDYIESFKELYHFGIKGMRWGVRRYQNTDGSLTTLGKMRTKRIEKAIVANDRDVANLKKYGYNKEAEAVKTVGDKLRKKLPENRERKERLKEDPLHREKYNIKKIRDFINKIGQKSIEDAIKS